jgi:small subunit ribosomal protein S12
MPTINQLIKKKRKIKKRRTKVLSLKSCPQRKGVCIEIRNNVSPKKPNSAKRKVAKVKLTTGRHVLAAIPGQGHNLQKFSIVMVRGGRARDIPGIRYKLIKGKYDFSLYERIERKKSRSKYGYPKIKKNK